MIETAATEAAIQQQLAKLATLREAIAKVIVGQHDVVEQLLIGLLAGGHCMLEGVPGLGKTLLVRSLGEALALEFRRIQFTPDLLPSDVTGVSVYNQSTREFEFKPGGIFAHIVLGDEINRAAPKTQSGRREAMAEGQV